MGDDVRDARGGPDVYVAAAPTSTRTVGDIAALVRSSVTAFAVPLALLVLQLGLYGMPLGAWIRGVVIGLLTALLAIGMALVYRANRVLNFAQADLGFVPTTLMVGLVAFSGWPYVAAFGLGLLASALLGAIVETAVIRRFSRSPRLVLTVATLGLAQLLLFAAILVPRLWDEDLTAVQIDPPFDWRWEIGTFVLTASDILAMIIAPAAMIAVALFLGRTRLGVAVRAAAERSDRAAMLGIPVGWLSTIVWSLASVLSFIALFLRADILSVPLGSALSLSTLVQALAALVIGRLRNLPLVAATAVALGVLEYGVQWNEDSALIVQPIVGAAVLVALLAQRRSSSRLDADTTSSWSAVGEMRPLSDRQARLPIVRLVRWTLVAVAVAGLVAIPVLLRVDQVIKATAVVVFAIIGVSLVVLTGWAGQISLGQVAFAAIGAAVTAKCSIAWNLDVSLSLVAGGAAGAVAALLVGVPALRLRGLYLAVTTLVFSMAVTSWLLNDRFFDWVPDDRLVADPLFGRIALDTPTRLYVLSLVVFGIVLMAVRGVRRSRTGRAIIATRENPRAAQSYSLSSVRVTLTAFVLSGAIAGVAGGLFAYLNVGFTLEQYQTSDSITVFVASVVGGLGSMTGAVLGAIYLKGGEWFITDADWRVLTTGGGVLLVLLILPGGLGGLIGVQRERFLRWAESRSAATATTTTATTTTATTTTATTTTATTTTAITTTATTTDSDAAADDGAVLGQEVTP